MNYPHKPIILLQQIVIILFLFFSTALKAQNEKLVANYTKQEAFSLTDCSIFYDDVDNPTVEKTAELFAKDIKAVTGKHLSVTNKMSNGNVIILGILGESKMIDELVLENKLDI